MNPAAGPAAQLHSRRPLPAARPGASGLLQNIPAALLVAMISLSYAASYSAMVFGSAGSEVLAAGLPLVLLSAFTMLLLVSLTSSLPFMIAGTDSNATGILALTVSGMAVEMRAGGSSVQEMVATMLVTMTLSTLLSGVFLTAVGVSKRGNLVQYVPFPVVGGFLAGNGYLLLSGAFSIATGHTPAFHTLPSLAHLHWLVVVPALIVAGTMMLGSRLKWDHPTLLPLALLAASAVFYIGLHFSGIDIERARSLGWLFENMHLKTFHLPLSLQASAINWGVIGHHYSELFAMIAVVTLTILLNATGIGLAARRDIDFNHELRSAGMANLVSGLFGGIVGCQSMSRTMVAFKAGARGRATGILAALICLACVIFFSDVIAWLPKPVLAGMLCGLGLLLLVEWLLKSWRRLSATEYCLIVAILVVITIYGFVAGVALGIVVACVLFVVEYGRVSCIKLEFTGNSMMSKVERPLEVIALLQEHGARAYGLCLQGFLFFGSATQVVNRVREQLKTPRECIIVDFRRVQGMDASTSQCFGKLAQICEQKGTTLVLTGMQPAHRLQIADIGASTAAVREFADLDAALEWLEEDLLERLQKRVGEPEMPAILVEHFSKDQLHSLLNRMEVLYLPADSTLFHAGDAGDCMYFIESGRVSIWLTLEAGKKMRLRSFGSGTIVGEMSLYTGQTRTADVVTDGLTRVRKLTVPQLRMLEAEDPATALQLHNFVVKVLAKRLSVTNEAYRLAF